MLKQSDSSPKSTSRTLDSLSHPVTSARSSLLEAFQAQTHTLDTPTEALEWLPHTSLPLDSRNFIFSFAVKNIFLMFLHCFIFNCLTFQTLTFLSTGSFSSHSPTPSSLTRTWSSRFSLSFFCVSRNPNMEKGPSPQIILTHPGFPPGHLVCCFSQGDEETLVVLYSVTGLFFSRLVGVVVYTGPAPPSTPCLPPQALLGSGSLLRLPGPTQACPEDHITCCKCLGCGCHIAWKL